MSQPASTNRGGRLARGLRNFVDGLVRRVSLAASGRIDHTWTARGSGTSRAYEAAVENRSNADWRTGLTSATMAILEGLDVMLARSRWLIRNDGYASSAQGGYRRKVVGGGITARASARNPNDGKMLKQYNAQHDLLWNAWAMDPLTVDVEQTKCLYEKQALWMDELFAAGGVLLRPVYTPKADGIGLAIQEIEYEQLNTSLTSFGGNAVYHGVETDEFGAPVAYHVYAAAHPLEEQPSQPTRLLASECWHLFRKSRVRQRLGVPMMASVMPALRDLAMFEMYTRSSARSQAAYHGFIEEPAASTATVPQIVQQMGGKPPAPAESEAEIQVRVEQGLFPVLRGGRKVTFATPTQPNSTYEPYVLQNLKRISSGTGLDLPTVARWYADGNFNTQRRAELETQAEVEAIQDLQFINGILRRVREMWTEIAVREGKLSATGFTQSARWRAAYLTTNWQGPPRRSVDEIKDQAGWDMQYRSLRGTPQMYCNERGMDVRDLLSEWREFIDMATEEYGLGEQVQAIFGGGQIPMAPAAGMQPDGTGPDGNPADTQPGAGDGGNGNGNGNGKGGGKNGKGKPAGMGAGLVDRYVESAIWQSVLGADERGTRQ